MVKRVVGDVGHAVDDATVDAVAVEETTGTCRLEQ